MLAKASVFFFVFFSPSFLPCPRQQRTVLESVGVAVEVNVKLSLQDGVDESGLGVNLVDGMVRHGNKPVLGRQLRGSRLEPGELLGAGLLQNVL